MDYATNWGNWNEEQNRLLTIKLVEIGSKQDGLGDSAIFEFNQYTLNMISSIDLFGTCIFPSSSFQYLNESLNDSIIESSSG